MKHTLLVVDDEEDLREMLRDALERRGFDVVTAGNGLEALAALEGIEHLCVVLLDLIMPEMNGWEFFDALRERKGYESVPVIVTTSAASRAPANAWRVLQKPLSLDRVVAEVQELCAAHAPP
ncbi:MAG: response regulator [Polyangiaceae bacterium]